MSRDEMPSTLTELASEMDLGELEDRFGYRPRIPGTVVLVLMTGIALTGLGTVFAGGEPLSAVVSLVILALVAWRVRRHWVRYRGGVYVFTGGIAEAYRNKVKKIFTWAEITSIQRRRFLVTVNLLPVLFERQFLITAVRADLGAPDGMLLDSGLLQANEVARLVANRIGQVSP